MHSFFIPQLGSQVYAMAGMTTRLHLVADRAGTYNGMSAAYGGGFEGMNAIASLLGVIITFLVRSYARVSMTTSDFDSALQTKAQSRLGLATQAILARLLQRRATPGLLLQVQQVQQVQQLQRKTPCCGSRSANCCLNNAILRDVAWLLKKLVGN